MSPALLFGHIGNEVVAMADITITNSSSSGMWT